MNKLKTLIRALLIVAPLWGEAQSLSLQAGPVVSFTRYSNRPLIRYGAGFVFEAPLNEKWAFALTVEHVARGGKNRYDLIGPHPIRWGRARIVFHEIGMRPGAAFNLKSGSRIAAGPRLSYLVRALGAERVCAFLRNCRLPAVWERDHTLYHTHLGVGIWLLAEKDLNERIALGGMLDLGTSFGRGYRFPLSDPAARVFIKWRIMR